MFTAHKIKTSSFSRLIQTECAIIEQSNEIQESPGEVQMLLDELTLAGPIDLVLKKPHSIIISGNHKKLRFIVNGQGRYITVPWCRFFIPKIASPGVRPGDPDLNEHISYAKCVKGHVIRSAADWVQCENLPAPDAPCWQEGGDTLFTLSARQRITPEELVKAPEIKNMPQRNTESEDITQADSKLENEHTTTRVSKP